MDPRKNHNVVAAVDELEKAGIPHEVIVTKKHVKIRFTVNGREQTYFTSSSPSDCRSHLNVRSGIRRMIAGEQQPIIAEEGNVVRFVPRIVTANDTAFVNSRDVADAFGKEHRNVLRDIDNLLKNIDCPILSSGLFRLSMMPDGQGIDRRTFDMTRDGFALLAMGFTGSKALQFKLQFIEAFNTMERALERVRAESSNAISAAEMAVLKGDLAALTDLVLEAKPVEVVKVRKAPFVRPSVLRKLRRAG